MLNYFKSKNIIITGATSGLGESLSKILGGLDTNLLLISRSREKLNVLKSVINNSKSIIQTLDLDLTKYISPKSLYNFSTDYFEHVDIIINNAGIGYNCFSTNVDMNIAKEIFQINFFNIVEINKLFLPSMIKRNKGVIVNISSLGGKRSFPTNSMYCASKFALEAYTESLRSELKLTNIKIVNIRPSFIKNTKFFDGKYVSKELGSNYENNIKEANKMSADDTAKIILKSIIKGKRDINISFMCKLVIILNNLFPRFVDMLVFKLREKNIVANLKGIVDSSS